MNHIRHPFWKNDFGASVATADLVTRMCRNPLMEVAGSVASQGPVLKTLSLCLFLAFGSAGYALPTSGVVTAGSATINSNGAGNLIINQTSPNATLNWQSFSVGTAESVKFVQPNSNSVAINRVLGSDPSRILGSLFANGKVFLVNPNGILFGKDASVNVGGLVASTLDLTDADFLAGRYRFDGSGKGEVSNLGNIHAADGGYVVLLGNKAGNEGTITAKLGTVSLAAGSAMTLGVAADGLLHVTIDKAALNALASNGGLVQADGGAVFISAKARDALLSTVVNNTGIVQANSVGYRNGRVLLDGGDSGIVNISGDVRVTGVAQATTGGNIIATGDKVLVADRTRLDATGTSGGGSIYVGGGWQGGDPNIRQASGVYIAPSATLDASATQNGNGGTVVAWSNVGDPKSVTRVYGSLLARGGAEGGDGGRIETSGHWLDVAGLRANAGAPRGKAGQWLLDPEDLTVGSVPTDALFFPGPLAMFISGPGTPNVLNTDIESQLNAGTSVVLQTAPTGPGNGNISIVANIAKTAGADAALILNAYGNISLGPGNTIASSAGKLDVNLNSLGTITFGAGSNVSSNGGNIAMIANSVIGMPALVGTGPATLTVAVPGATSVGLGSGAGDLSLPSNFATGFSAVNIYTGSVNSPTGNSGINIYAGAGDVTIGGAVSFTDSMAIVTSGNIAVNAGGSITTSKAGGNLALSGANFVNYADAGAVSTSGGAGARWIIYSNDPSTNTFGSLNSGNQAIWGQTFSSLPPGSVASGNRYVFATPGAVTAATTGTVTKTYGQLISLTGNVTYSGTPLTSAATYGNVYQDLSIGDVLSVAPTITSVGAAAGATVAGSPYAVTASGGVANSGYSISYVNNGLLVVNKAALEITALADTKVYNGQPYFGGNGVAYSGFLNGDDATGLGGTLVYGGSSQGVVNAGQYVIVPLGLTSNDYSIRYVGSPLTVKPKEVTVTGLVANNKEFDGTNLVIIPNWGMVNTGVGQETLVLNHGGASFSDAAIGIGKTVTVDGYSLANGDNGGLVSNYVLKSRIATTTADIVAATRTQTVKSVQAALNGLAGSGNVETRRGTLYLDSSQLGLSSGEIERSNATGPSHTEGAAGVNERLVISGNRLVVGALASSSPTPRSLGSFGTGSTGPGLPGAAAAGAPGAIPGTSRFSTSGLSSLPKPTSRTTAPRAAQLPRDVYLKGAARASVVGSTTSGSAVLATLAVHGRTARLTVTVATGDGFGISIPRDLMDKSGAKGDLASIGATSSAGALPAWITFDRNELRLVATSVPPGALPLTVKLLGTSGKSVEVTFK